MIKNYISISAMLIAGAMFTPSLQPQAHAQDVQVSSQVSFQTFYDELSPYGQWVNDPQYGNVWVPNEEPGYRPYATRGHWAMTDQGNMWVSDVPWGWACYHYGRWTYNGYYGWVWIPGYEWAPAWVNWRSGGGYYGWAPMGPGQYPGSYYEYPVNYWVFVSPQYLYQPNVYGYYEPRYVDRYYARTEYINETYRGGGTAYYYGPRAEVIERETHQPVQVYNISNASRPGEARMGGNGISVYRPAVNRESINSARPANVVTASHPIGKPEGFSGNGEAARPAFREEMQKQNPAFSKPNTYSNNSAQQNGQMNHSEPQSRPAGEQGGQQMNHNQPGQQQPQPQHFQPAQNNTQQMNRNQPEPAQRNQPAAEPVQHNQQAAQPAQNNQQRTQPANNGQEGGRSQGSQTKQKSGGAPKEKKK